MRVFFFKLIPQTLFIVRMRLCGVCDNKNIRLVLIECVSNDKIMIRILFSHFLDAHWVLSSNLRVRPASACCDTWQHEKNSSASRTSSSGSTFTITSRISLGKQLSLLGDMGNKHNSFTVCSTKFCIVALDHMSKCISAILDLRTLLVVVYFLACARKKWLCA